jgi:hypothetical protein
LAPLLASSSSLDAQASLRMHGQSAAAKKTTVPQGAAQEKNKSESKNKPKL